MNRFKTIGLLTIGFLLSIYLNKISAQWEKHFDTKWEIQSVVFKDDVIFMGTSYNGLVSSKNSGQTWVESKDIVKSVGLIYLSGDSLYVSSAEHLYLSNDNGLNWTSVIENISVSTMAKNKKYFLLGTSNGLFLSSDNGNSWEHTQAQMLSYAIISSFYMDDIEVYAATYDWGLHRSTDYGKNWSLTTSPYYRNSIISIQKIDSDLFVSTYGGVSKSTDNGNSWIFLNAGIENKPIYSLNKKDKSLFAASGTKIFCLMQDQSTWLDISFGLPSNNGVRGLIMGGDFIYTIVGKSIWRRNISEIITSIERSNKYIPMKFSLEQNFPNPFNPSTTISYEIPQNSFVTLEVYDILGRKVATLVQEQKAIGIYNVAFNANEHSSGIYFYTLRTKDFIQTKKMILIR